ncbi:hypothetical protein [Bacillus sp. Au-Bac7]|uniref:hypothetical protein n=1 Tax=Bacillus sp. Au-Bac7 TaxID=2906458 RepID=UPI001E654095|nr:hypothetical protein [Bacillus sp. Au-Bac7]MCE4051703.1 hypothetical protein [Bacillus sp. Au-Bac7]
MIREEEFGIRGRKVRSDKKRDVKPTISVELKNCIYRLSYITNTPVKDVSEIICKKGLQSRKVIENLSHHFRREYRFMNTIYIGDPGRESLQSKSQKGKNERITTRFTQYTYEEIKDLSGALDVTPSKATALLLDASIRNTNLLDSFVKTYLHGTLDKMRMKELKYVLQYIKKNNPYSEEGSWFSLIALIVEDVKDNSINVKESIHNWLDKFK